MILIWQNHSIEVAGMVRKRKVNPHCPVIGCRTTRPHADDPMVRGLIRQFASPIQMTFWTLGAMGELRNSIFRDLEEKNLFAWLSRLRQPEELYIRTLYCLFVATDEELPHILSGDMPNGLFFLYSKVNDLVFEGKGQMLTELSGLNYGSFRPIDTLHDGAHASFRAFGTCIALANNPEGLLPVEKYRSHLTTYFNYLNYMHEMFKSGKEKKHVLEGVKNMHRPLAIHMEKATF